MLNYKMREAPLNPFPRPEGMDLLLHRLLVHRGIASAEEARRYLAPEAGDLSDPMRLSDMAPALEKIRGALAAGAPICVYGDYDVDGVSASAILADHLRALGARVRVYLPSRHREGYGLNEGAVREIAREGGLMITVDCGVTNLKEVALAKELGLDVIVTDHHRPAEALPDCPVVDPLLKDYPFPWLCGAGVAFRLVEALSGWEAALEYVDIAALATVADVVSLTGENRVIVKLGLEKLNQAPRAGILALKEAAGLQGRQLTAGNVSFQLAPRLNAAGRMGDAMDAHRLLLARDANEAEPLAMRLAEQNAKRQEEERSIEEAAEEQIAGLNLSRHRALVLVGADWNSGIIGLSAGRLAEKYWMPTILLSASGDTLVGSCRSIPGVDIHQALTACKRYFIRYGGHRLAAGLTMPRAALEDFKRDLEAWLSENVRPEAWIPVKEYDLEAPFDALTEEFVGALTAMEPTGYGNPGPVLRSQPWVEGGRTMGTNGAHLSLILSGHGVQRRGVFFGGGPLAESLPEAVDILYTPKFNDFRGHRSVEVEIKALVSARPREDFRRKIQNASRLQHEFLTESIYNGMIREVYPDVPSVTPEALREWLKNDAQGTVILAADGAQALKLLEALGDVPLDLWTGPGQEGPRVCNTLWLYPVGALRRRWRRVVTLGMPPVQDDEDVERWQIGAPAELWNELPDLEALRRIYRAARSVVRGAERYLTLTQLLTLMALQSGLSAPACLMGLAVLDAAELIRFRPEMQAGRTTGIPFLAMGEAKKADPTDTTIYRALREAKGKYGA